MPDIKISTLFNGSSNAVKSVFGFSETWYTDRPADQAVQIYKTTIAQKRIALLPEDVSIYGYRVQPATAGARSYTVLEKDDLEGPAANGGANVPQDAALCRVFGTVDGVVKRFWVHCLPDSFINTGGFDAALGVEELLRAYITSVIAAGFKIRFQDTTAPSSDILSVAADGTCVLVNPLAGAVVGAKISILHARDRYGRGVRGIFRVSNVGYIDTSHFTIYHWPGAEIFNSGKARLVSYRTCPCNPLPRKGGIPDPIIRPGVRKCGRPFGQLRGRVSARR
jgi:hypothetical protein